jgi:hypothetical protein
MTDKALLMPMPSNSFLVDNFMVIQLSGKALGLSINLPFSPIAILSAYHFVNPPFGQLAILSACHFVSLSFCQLAILLIRHLVNLPFC